MSNYSECVGHAVLCIFVAAFWRTDLQSSWDISGPFVMFPGCNSLQLFHLGLPERSCVSHQRTHT